MPVLDSPSAVISFDVRGCPQRCRHCWLGVTPNGRISEGDVRRIAAAFRAWTRPGDHAPFFRKLTVQTWYREPDYSPNYRDLYALERELSDDEPERHELLSVWRLARDESYAQWAREIGTEVCQLTVFGMEETTDWFIRRKGAFLDTILATERLLAAGIRPRWQVFLTMRGLPEFSDLVRLADDLDLERRCRALGGGFAFFLHTPGPDGAAYEIEHLRPTDAEVYPVERHIPEKLVEKTMEHLGVSDREALFGRPEADLLPDLLAEDAPWGWRPRALQFMVTPAFDLYTNVAEPFPWWRLGNIGDDGLGACIGRFERDEPPGYRAHFRVPMRELARRFGVPDGRRIYAENDLRTRLVRQAAMETFGEEVAQSG